MIFLIVLGTERKGEAADSQIVSTEKELREALGREGEKGIILDHDIEVSAMLIAKGKKVIYGKGKYQIARKVTKQGTYEGTLLCATGQGLALQEVTLDGKGTVTYASDSIYGRLLEVRKGVVILKEGTKLSRNYNLRSSSNGGGGIVVKSGAGLVMKKGSLIQDNLTMGYGAGVYVESGGSFVMEGGTIRDNAVIGQSIKTAFDGRGGGIYNAGNTDVKDGQLIGNVVRPYGKKKISDEGKGAGIYNAGKLCMDSQVSAQSIYLERGHVLQIRGEDVPSSPWRLEFQERASGRRVVSGVSKNWKQMIKLSNQDAFELYYEKGNLYLKKKKQPEKKKKTMSDSKKESPKPTQEVREKMEIMGNLKPKTTPLTPLAKEEKEEIKLLPVSPDVVTESVPLVLTTTIEEDEGERESTVRFVDDSYEEYLPNNSIWRQQEYVALLSETLRKKEEQYEQVWHISSEEQKQMKRYEKENQEGGLLIRCQNFLKKFSTAKTE